MNSIWFSSFWIKHQKQPTQRLLPAPMFISMVPTLQLWSLHSRLNAIWKNNMAAILRGNLKSTRLHNSIIVRSQLCRLESAEETRLGSTRAPGFRLVSASSRWVAGAKLDEINRSMFTRWFTLARTNINCSPLHPASLPSPCTRWIDSFSPSPLPNCHTAGSFRRDSSSLLVVSRKKRSWTEKVVYRLFQLDSIRFSEKVAAAAHVRDCKWPQLWLFRVQSRF